eukprot:jgi/Bigna1/140745/aug1.58_g15453
MSKAVVTWHVCTALLVSAVAFNKGEESSGRGKLEVDHGLNMSMRASSLQQQGGGKLSHVMKELVTTEAHFYASMSDAENILSSLKELERSAISDEALNLLIAFTSQKQFVKEHAAFHAKLMSYDLEDADKLDGNALSMFERTLESLRLDLFRIFLSQVAMSPFMDNIKNLWVKNGGINEVSAVDPEPVEDLSTDPNHHFNLLNSFFQSLGIKKFQRALKYPLLLGAAMKEKRDDAGFTERATALKGQFQILSDMLNNMQRFFEYRRSDILSVSKQEQAKRYFKGHLHLDHTKSATYFVGVDSKLTNANGKKVAVLVAPPEIHMAEAAKHVRKASEVVLGKESMMNISPSTKLEVVVESIEPFSATISIDDETFICESKLTFMHFVPSIVNIMIDKAENAAKEMIKSYNANVTNKKKKLEWYEGTVL